METKTETKYQKYVLLGEKRWWHYIALILLIPVWALRAAGGHPVKSFRKFNNGLIPHKHQFNYGQPNLEFYKGKLLYKYYDCEHDGCNLITTEDVPGEKF